jgi:hypothetical protein
MKTSKQVNAKDLLMQAKASEHKEAYQLVNKTVNYRVGIGARIPLSPTQPPTFFVEVIINMCPACSKVDLAVLERALVCLKTLEQNGYTLTSQDSNSILCEKPATEQTLQEDLEEAKGIVEKGLEK